MRTASKLSGIALASAAAALFLAGCGGKSETTKVEKEASPDAATKVATIKCSGINSCKGTGACGTATHGCAGQNSCKGQGWVKATKADCDAKGGKVVADK